MITERELLGFARDIERANRLVKSDRPNTASELLISVAERLWDAILATSSLTPMVGAEGGAPGPVVVQAEPGPVGGGADTASPARASISPSPLPGWRGFAWFSAGISYDDDGDEYGQVWLECRPCEGPVPFPVENTRKSPPKHVVEHCQQEWKRLCGFLPNVSNPPKGDR